ncbi:DNA polymerase I [Pediococcus claussenii]|uniref:DNA polymerase I n=1 Tax=Pediococcus claussenii (strain ATCC BAA-344 / DSM 14800 / JCM 18046 / KCTC 3811 / LMG 21948 / P06) TaxID=701521 RepID=G8PDR9_PEDCP|nr:DNA polymerase I [Pediococcus claussenii]AEV95404.1 DNA polymerase I [Pediococcus claussenii ATCC BAA-344]ANZ68934.1 DNA polymerase I [Pediococcus claussenii]ANZ70750.1 DNA polymerase I [Pediococcus claussenii]KRN19047.1 polA protein [Pediococcus claussenii]
MTDKRLLLIDGNSIAFRSFFALQNSLSRFTNADGLHTNAIYGFNKMLDIILDNVNPTDALVAFDAGKTTFRTKMYTNYKGGRAKTPSELTEQMPYLRDLLTGYGIKSYELADYEADDIIGTLSLEAEKLGYRVTIVTGDRDLTQLVSDKTTVAVTVKGVTEVEDYTPEHLKEKLGVTPTQVIDLKGLMGDSSDNYPGVTKVGEKTALKLIDQFGSVENLYDHIDDLKQSKMKEHLIEDEDNAFLSKKLATIDRDSPLKIGLDQLEYKGINEEYLIDFYQKMGFKSYLKKFQKSGGLKEVEQTQFQELTKANLDKAMESLGNEVSLYLEMPEKNYHLSSFAGFVIGNDEKWFVSRNVELLKLPTIKDLIENIDVKLNVFDSKRTYVGLNRLEINAQCFNYDVLLQSYLLDTNENSNDLGLLAQQHAYYNVESDADVYGTGAKLSIPDDDQTFFQHLANKGKAIEVLGKALDGELKQNEQDKLYWEIELPLAIVLAKMEISGIRVDSNRLIQMQSEFAERLSEIEGEIYRLAGEEFNINSPKQLGRILFEKMRLPIIKKTKTGYSTAVDVLEKLRGESDIVDDILNYRTISKIQSTYVEGLLKVVHSKDQKIHTTYIQTLTQTGRLSSIEPNLQNIPVRIDEGKKIRQAFVPSKEGWHILSSDYSQIELRVLAHLTGDKNMQEAFIENQDIHASTAVRIFGLKDASEVTPNIRRQAKAVNFGIVYGISDYGLSQNIGISRSDAKKFIETYFQEFPGVKNYVDNIVKVAKEQGYVETISHRRRYLPDINSSNFSQRSFAERTAMNTPIQGSAADIIKIAMIKMQQELESRNLKTKMLLQVHDELIFEVPDEEMNEIKKLVPSVMDSAMKLKVPLKVETSWGNNWYEAK